MLVVLGGLIVGFRTGLETGIDCLLGLVGLGRMLVLATGIDGFLVGFSVLSVGFRTGLEIGIDCSVGLVGLGRILV